MSNARGRSIEETDHPAWAAWLEYSGHVTGTTMGLDSTWEPFKAGYDVLNASRGSKVNLAFELVFSALEEIGGQAGIYSDRLSITLSELRKVLDKTK